MGPASIMAWTKWSQRDNTGLHMMLHWQSQWGAMVSTGAMLPLCCFLLCAKGGHLLVLVTSGEQQIRLTVWRACA